MPRFSSLVASSFVLLLTLAPPNARAAQVIEFYHAKLDHYFVTTFANEINALETGVHQGWARTGYTFQVFDAGDPRLAGSINVCRFYGNPAKGLDSHFYSATQQECNDVKVKFPDAWLLEADEVFRMHPVNPATGACPANTKPVHRLFNRRTDANHRYTTDAAVFDQMVAKGYQAEGVGGPRPVVFCAADPTAAPPTCSLSVSSAQPNVNTNITLTASCTNGPTSYQWSNCTSATNTCTTTASVAGERSYAVTALNASGASAPAFVTVNWQQPVTSPPVCSLTANPSAPFAGTTVTLTANCTQSPTSYSWVNCFNATGNTCRVANAITGQVTYSVTATNAFGSGSPASITVTWQPPPPPGADLCGSFAKVLRVDLPWGGHLDTEDHEGTFEADIVVSGRIIVPPGATGSIPGVISIVEHAADPPVARTVSLSTAACDFRGFTPGVFPTPDPTGNNAPLGWAFGINPSTQIGFPGMPGSYPKLVPGQVYYINIRNREFGDGSLTCSGQTCNVRITVNTPR